MGQMMWLTTRTRPDIAACLGILRYEQLLTRAEQTANLQLSYSFRSWILLSILRLPAKRWSELLEKLGHSFPRDEAQYRQLEQFLLRDPKDPAVVKKTLAILI